MTPADEIYAAAKRIYERAAHAQPGPWYIGNAVDPTQLCNIHTHPGCSSVADTIRWLDAEHIGLWSPDRAVFVADLLIHTVEKGVGSEPALRLARAINGGAS
jgi:hypothetical protein